MTGTTPPSPSRDHFLFLDGFRVLSTLLIMALHTTFVMKEHIDRENYRTMFYTPIFAPFVHGFVFAVETFFVLTGFLITSSLLSEQKNNNSKINNEDDGDNKKTNNSNINSTNSTNDRKSRGQSWFGYWKEYLYRRIFIRLFPLMVVVALLDLFVLPVKGIDHECSGCVWKTIFFVANFEPFLPAGLDNGLR